MATSLEVRGVSLRFGGVRALTDVSFAINEGELFSIIGPNGAGKTSIVNCISGRYKPTEGQLFYRGRDITGLTPNARPTLGIGRTFQNLRPVPPHERARQHHGRPPSPLEEQFPHGLAVLAHRRAQGRARAPPQGRGDHRLPATSSRCARRPPAPSPTACASASSSPAPWRWSRASSSSTSRWPA